ncbi:MAG: response regulator transcription factor [Acidobacteria bacterium]|nr:response regulator transcription factor [Acidobacteriota bacterium]
MKKAPSSPPAPAPRRRILLIEDEEDLARSIRYHLEKEGGFTVATAETGERGLLALREKPADLILLDLMLPGVDGLEICRAVRSSPATARIPIVMLTARVEETDRIVGLEMGADDYITKPFSMKELLARVRAHLRREERAVPAPAVFRDDLVAVDFEAHTVTADGKDVALTRKEFDLLAALVRGQGRVLTREHLLEKIWGYQYFEGTRTVDVHMFRVRQKLGERAGERIETVVGVGYRYRSQPPR